jgi:signal transduction histidine kinase
MSSEPRSSKRRLGVRGGVFGRLNVRLTLWFTVVFLVTSLAVFTLTYATTFRTLRADERERLFEIAFDYYLIYSSAVTEPAGFYQLTSEIQREIGQPGNAVLVRIATTDNQTLYSRVASEELQHGFDLSVFETTAMPIGELLTLKSETLDYDLEVLTVFLPLSSGHRILQVATNTSERVRILRVFQRGFGLTLVILLGISVVGGLFFVSRTLSPLGDLTDTISGIIETGSLDRRLPARKTGDDLDHLVGAFNSMLDRIQRLVVELRDALDAVAHDLRTPMTRFRAIAESALSDGTPEDPSMMREALSDALEESENILSMLNAMMDISEAESGAMRLNTETVDLGALCRRASEVYGLVADEKGMTIAVEFEELSAEVDAGRMRQVIGNLLDNAIKYGDRDTTITVHGTRASVDGAEKAVLTVENFGTAIKPEELSRIWDRLYRGENDGETQGLGLGLTLVRAIVEAHGGSARVDSTPDGPTRFTITLPSA